MLEELIKHEKLGSKNELSFLLLKALSLSKSQKTADLRSYCLANHYTIGQSINGILKLLEFMKLVRILDEQTCVADEFFLSINKKDGDFDQYEFIRIFLIALEDESAIDSIFPPDAIKRDDAENLFYIKKNFVPLRYTSIRNLLISLGFFEHDTPLGSSVLVVNQAYTDLFLDKVVKNIKEINQKQRRNTLQSLKTRQERQELLGKEAEIFVLGFEKLRLNKHPLLDNVQRISDDYVSAGYDIESFNDINSIFVDRFIEVKSCSGLLEFYWSANEVDVAKELADKYFIYLVDRDKILNHGYVPRIIQNPYQNVFKNTFWKREAQTWRFSFQDDK